MVQNESKRSEIKRYEVGLSRSDIGTYICTQPKNMMGYEFCFGEGKSKAGVYSLVPTPLTDHDLS